MIIFGVDPGYGRTGWGVINWEKPKASYVACGLIETLPNIEFCLRIGQIYKELNRLIKLYKAEAMAIETLYFNKNVKTAILAAHARGVAVLAGVEAEIPVTDYTPLQIKNALIGYGRGSKDQIKKMLELQLEVKGVFDQDDAADGVACALTHALNRKAW